MPSTALILGASGGAAATLLAPVVRASGHGKPRVVVVGAGIIGASAAYHLAKFGWKDIVEDYVPVANP